jgi:hypothetical protein
VPRAGRQLAEAETAVRQDHPELDVEPILRTASLAPTLIALSEDARLMVVGSRGALIHHAPAPSWSSARSLRLEALWPVAG